MDAEIARLLALASDAVAEHGDSGVCYVVHEVDANNRTLDHNEFPEGCINQEGGGFWTPIDDRRFGPSIFGPAESDAAMKRWREIAQMCGAWLMATGTLSTSPIPSPTALWKIQLLQLPKHLRQYQKSMWFCNAFGANVEMLRQLATAKMPFVPIPFSLLDRFPATSTGLVAFLEWVRDEIRYAADAKRAQLNRGYSNATIESMVRGIKWPEARVRLSALPEVLDSSIADVGKVLTWDLTSGTIEQVDQLLFPAVNQLRKRGIDKFQKRNDSVWSRPMNAAELDLTSFAPTNIVVVATVGDLWKACAENKRPCYLASGISITPGPNTPYATDEKAESSRSALELAQALVASEGGAKSEAIEKLIARVQLRTGKSKATVVNMSLSEFVAILIERTINATPEKGQNDTTTLMKTDTIARKSNIIKVLLLSANPIDSRLDIDREFRAIDMKVRSSAHRDHVELIKHGAIRLEDLAGLLMRHKPHVVHFSGHGNADGVELTISDGTGRPVPPGALANILHALKDNLRVVLLNACDSASQAEAIVTEIDCAVGMSDEIEDEAAIAFAAAFYEVLGYGRSVQSAFNIALVQLEDHEEDRSLARLYTRQGIKASDVVLVNPSHPQ